MNKDQTNELAAFRKSFTRRQVFIQGAASFVALAGAGALGKALYAQTASAPATTPEVTEGPYWIDEKLNRVDIRLDPSTGLYQAGLPLYLGVTVSQYNSTTGVASPLPNAFVDLWHANALGVYSDEPANNNSTAESTSGQLWLRGYQVTNAHGNVKFTTVYPSWYVSRTVHIHARVRIFPDNDITQTATYDFTTQFFFDDTISDYVIANVSPYSTRPNRDTTNATDSVFTGASFLSQYDNVTTEAGDYLLLRLAEDKTHAVGSFHMILDLSETASTGGGTGGGPPGGTGGGGTGGGPPGGTGGGTPPGG